jgi:putative addiction module component (TIGR02574 family)
MSIDEIMHLDVAERIVIVEEIWDSLAREEADIPLSEYEKNILDTRLASLEADPDNLTTWEEIKKKIRYSQSTPQNNERFSSAT